jgi:hypothetical protein
MGKRNRSIKIFLLIIIVFCSCKSKTTPVNLLLDYSYDSGWAYSYSVKVYSDGKAYLRKNNLRTDSLYVKDKINVDGLHAIISKVKEANIARKYEDTYVQDAASFNFIIYLNDGRVSKCYVYGYKYPDLLLRIKDYANLLSKERGWDRLKDTTITFSSMANFNYVPKIIDTVTLVLPPKNL